MGGQEVTTIGVMVICIFLLIGLVVIGFFLFLHYVKQKEKDNEDQVINSGPQRPAYNRSTSIIITAPSQYDDNFEPAKQQVRTNGEPSARQEQQNFL